MKRCTPEYVNKEIAANKKRREEGEFCCSKLMHNNVLPLCCEQVVVQREHHQGAKEQAKRAQHVPHIVVVEEIKDNTILVQKKVQGIVLDVRIEIAKGKEDKE